MQVQQIKLANPVFEAEFGKPTKKAPTYKDGAPRRAFTLSVDVASLPLESLTFLLNYGLSQYIADGAAGAEDEAGYKAGLDLRIRKLQEADFSRSRGEAQAKPDSEEVRARKLAAMAIREKLKAAGAKADAKAINEAAAKMVAADPKWTKAAAKQLADEAKLREAEAEADDGLGDIMASLLADAGGNASEADDEEE